MSNYTKTTDFEAKDSLPSGDNDKIIKGAEFETEFDAISTAIATKADTAGPTFTGTATFATTNATTVQIGGVAITSTAAELNTLDGITSTTAELNTLDGFTGTVDDLNYAKDLRASGVTGDEFDILDGLTATAAELNILDGATLSTAELNLLDGVTATTAELNILDGVTSTGIELNILDGVTATTAELNLLDGITATTTELNYVDGVTSSIQSQIDTKSPIASPTFTGTVTIPTADINGGAVDGVVIGGTTAAAGSFTTVSATGNITVDGTVDGRDVATDGTKLDGIEASATADQTDAEIRAAVEAATDSNVFTDADHTKLDGIETLADVTDTTNVTAAGALMDSELTNLTAVKSLDQGVATTDSPTFAGLTTTANVSFGDNDKAIFGAGSDLQIYHDGSNSFIADVGTGNLGIRAENLFLQNADGSANYATASLNGAFTLSYNNSIKLATTNTGIDVTGTATMDGLTVDGGSGNSLVNFTPSGTFSTVVDFSNASSDFQIVSFGSGSASANNFRIRDDGASRLNIAGNGDISFYEDTGTTAKLFWDASAEALGIGTSSPDSALVVQGGQGTYAQIKDGTVTTLLQARGQDSIGVVGTLSNHGFGFFTNSTERMRIDSSGNVGIGTSSPSAKIDTAYTDSATYSSTSPSADLILSRKNTANSNNQTVGIRFDVTGWSGSTTGGVAIEAVQPSNASTADLSFLTRNAGTWGERMRIDASGNVGIGTSSPSAGLELNLASGDGLLINSADVGTIKMKTTAGSVKNWGFAHTNLAAGDFGIYQSNSNGGDPITAGTARMYFNGTGDVGIGTSPSSKLHVYSAASTASIVQDAGTALRFLNNSGTNFIQSGTSLTSDSKAPLIFSSMLGVTEWMRLDTSGNLLVGKSSSSFSTAGIEARSGGTLWATADGTNAASFNRKTSDGAIAYFSKDGTTVGSIGTYVSLPFIGKSDVNLLFDPAGPHMIPRGTNGGARDAAINLGSSSNRFKDLYLSGGAYLGGTGSANKLDDYEEGTFTPAVAGTTTAGSASYSIQQGTYTKIGRLVYYSIRIGYSSHTGAGNMIINGLPFTSDALYSAGEYSYRDGLTVPSNEDLKVYVPPSQSHVGLYAGALGTDFISALALDTAVTDLSINGVYHV